MSQRYVELFIGRLLTDEDLRRDFLHQPAETIDGLCATGWELTRAEIDAILSREGRVWSELASRIPSKLQRCSLRSE